MDEHDAALIPYNVPEPRTSAGDAFFATSFVGLQPAPRRPTSDLRDKAIELLRQIDKHCDIDTLRFGRLNRQKTAVRKELAAALLQADYPGRKIADFLRVSDSTISLVATKMRYSGDG